MQAPNSPIRDIAIAIAQSVGLNIQYYCPAIDSLAGGHTTTLLGTSPNLPRGGQHVIAQIKT